MIEQLRPGLSPIVTVGSCRDPLANQNRIAVQAGRCGSRWRKSNDVDTAVEQDQQRGQSADDHAKCDANEGLPPIARDRL
jgi:hypothetical protein